MKKVKSDNFMNKVLIFIAVVLVVFTIVNLWLFFKIGAVPDVLITSVFAACLGEMSLTSWIKNTKQKYRDDAPFEEEEE